MKYPSLLAICALVCMSCQNTGKQQESSFQMIEPVDFSHVKITDNFWGPRLANHAKTTLAVCIDQIENQTGRIRNFENAARKAGEHSGIFFDDSDVYKAMEGIAYSLINNPDPKLEQKADEWIDKFAAAQEPDGYINTYYTLTGLDKRWRNMDKHEMYCAGHMIEAAVAYYQATGKRKLLDVSERMVEHIMNTFGPGKRHWVPGHEEIELALVKLYKVTNDERYLNFAHWLIEERGHGHGTMADEGTWNPVYYQDEMPVREMSEIKGHAVRCMYLYCGMADVAVLKQDTGYINAMHRLWNDVVIGKMYVTGGIGSSHHNEGFTEAFDLPNYDAYCETCASVGMVYWNSRMNRLTGDAKYIDVLERSMYNGALAGISLSGDRFFYVNPLASKGNHHRQEWYGCACCPSQVSRFIPSVGNYMYGTSDDALWINLFIGSEAEIFFKDKEHITVKQETNYPWEGKVKITIECGARPFNKKIYLRLPEWSPAYNLVINNEPYRKGRIEKGYIVLDDQFRTGTRIEFDLNMDIEAVAADPRVKENAGKRAIQRGPLVYCIEETDNPTNFSEITLTPEARYASWYDADFLNGVAKVTATSPNGDINLIPYYAWDNREPGEMKVWIDYKE